MYMLRPAHVHAWNSCVHGPETCHEVTHVTHVAHVHASASRVGGSIEAVPQRVTVAEEAVLTRCVLCR